MLDKRPEYCHRNLRLCGEHFEDNAFRNACKRNRLKNDAIPTKFDVPNPPAQLASKRKLPTRIPVPEKKKKHTVCENTGSSSNTGTTADVFSSNGENTDSPSAYTSSTDEFSDLSREELLARIRSQATTVNKLRKDRKRQSTIIWKLKKKVKGLKEAPLRSRKGKHKVQAILRYFHENFPERTAKFLSSQIKLQGKNKHGFRFSNSDKELALTLYYQSPKCYRTLRKLFHLPCKQTLLDWTKVIDVQPGISDFIMNVLAIKAKSMNESERNCVLLMDEVSLKPGYQYDIENDIIDGFVDYGHLGRKNRGANRALVFMIRGLRSCIKQTIGYFFSQNACPAGTLKNLLLSVIDKVNESGFRVRAVIGDVGSSNSSMVFSKMDLNENEPYFYHNDNKVYFFFDPPHLLKCTRNNLHNHDFIINEDTISWQYVKIFYLKDGRLKIKMAPKLTDRHIMLPAFSKMKVKLASQVFSRSVYVGMLTQVNTNQMTTEAIPTADFVRKMNDLFDCFNGKKVCHPNAYKRALSDKTIHVEYLNEMVSYIRSWNIGNISNEMFKFNKGWIFSIHSLLMLWDDLKQEGFKFLPTRQLNQDPLENYFGKVRMEAGSNRDPPITGFSNIIRNLMLTSLLEPPTGKNCEDDMDTFLLGKYI